MLDGPDEVENLLVTVIVGAEYTHHVPVPILSGWGVTDLIQFEVPGYRGGQRVPVTFTASADGCETITELVWFDTPDWWGKWRFRPGLSG